MEPETMLIGELAERAGVTVRTIRYYTDEGLLPQPEAQGKYAYYTQAHLFRLDLIRQLKDAYLPLREIRQVLQALTDEQVVQRLHLSPHVGPQKAAASAPPPPAPVSPTHLQPARSGAAALEYLRRVTDAQKRYKTPASQPPAPGSSALDSPRSADLPSDKAFPTEWKRIELAPGVELNVRQPLEPARADQVSELLRLADNLFQKY